MPSRSDLYQQLQETIQDLEFAVASAAREDEEEYYRLDIACERLLLIGETLNELCSSVHVQAQPLSTRWRRWWRWRRS